MRSEHLGGREAHLQAGGSPKKRRDDRIVRVGTINPPNGNCSMSEREDRACTIPYVWARHTTHVQFQDHNHGFGRLCKLQRRFNAQENRLPPRIIFSARLFIYSHFKPHVVVKLHPSCVPPFSVSRSTLNSHLRKLVSRGIHTRFLFGFMHHACLAHTL